MCTVMATGRAQGMAVHGLAVVGSIPAGVTAGKEATGINIV